MRHNLIAIALFAATAAPAVGQTQPEGSDITCGDFLALDAEAQMATMLDLRNVHSGDTVSAPEETQDATVVTGASEAGARGGIEAEPPTVPGIPDTPEARQRLSGMRTSCEGMPDMPATDALIAAHADYEPVFETTVPAN